MIQRNSEGTTLHIPRVVTQALKDEFEDDVIVSNGVWIIAGPWSIDDIYQAPDIISEIMQDETGYCLKKTMTQMAGNTS